MSKKFTRGKASDVLRFAAIVDDWLDNGNPADMFVDCWSITRCSVMEFLANQEGLTLYENGVRNAEVS